MMEKSEGLVETRTEAKCRGEELVRVIVPSCEDTTDTNDGKDEANQNRSENKDAQNAAVRAASTTTISSARTFEGQFRDYWKVGARIALRHGSNYLPGKITRADLTIARDVYDVQLDSGDVVYNVPSCDLRTPHLYFGLKVVAGIAGGAVTIVAFSAFFVCMAEMLIRFAHNQRALR